MISPTVEI